MPSISNLNQKRWLIDSPSIGQCVFRSMGLPVPYCQQNITVVHDLLIPFLKCFQDQFPRKFLPVWKKLKITDPHGCCGLERDRINPPGSAGNDLSDFPSAKTMFPAKSAEVLIFHHKVWHEVKLCNGPTAGNSKFHKEAPQSLPLQHRQAHPSK